MMTMTMPEPCMREVVLVCDAPDARAVYLAGTFNGWNPADGPMRSTGEGRWEITVTLPKGRHQYKFLVDGVWCCEVGCQGTTRCRQCVPDGCGAMNRLVVVK